MPNSKLPEFIHRLEALEKSITSHLIESGGIQMQLKINTWLTGVILVALLGKFVVEWFR